MLNERFTEKLICLLSTSQIAESVAIPRSPYAS